MFHMGEPRISKEQLHVVTSSFNKMIRWLSEMAVQPVLGPLIGQLAWRAIGIIPLLQDKN